MSRKLLLLLPLVALLLMGADQPVKVQLKIINRSGYALAIWLSGTYIEPGIGFFELFNESRWVEAKDEDVIHYYFTVPKGSRETPTRAMFEIARGQYTITARYTKPWDPVYPDNPCIQQPPKALIALRNTQITFTPCFLFPKPWTGGEPGMMKFWQLRKQVLY